MSRFPVDLAARVLALLEVDDHQPAATSMREPTDFATDPLRWERERRQFFERGAHVIAWSGELAEPGSFLTREVVGVPLLVTRDVGGVLRAFRNVCTHRGAEVASGCGSARRLTCAYHGWTFDVAGALDPIASTMQWCGYDRHQLVGRRTFTTSSRTIRRTKPSVGMHGGRSRDGRRAS